MDTGLLDLLGDRRVSQKDRRPRGVSCEKKGLCLLTKNKAERKRVIIRMQVRETVERHQKLPDFKTACQGGPRPTAEFRRGCDLAGSTEAKGRERIGRKERKSSKRDSYLDVHWARGRREAITHMKHRGKEESQNKGKESRKGWLLC